MYTFEAHYCKGRYLPGESEYNTSSSMTSCESQSVLGTYYIIILGNHQVGATNPKSHSALSSTTTQVVQVSSLSSLLMIHHNLIASASIGIIIAIIFFAKR